MDKLLKISLLAFLLCFISCNRILKTKLLPAPVPVEVQSVAFSQERVGQGYVGTVTEDYASLLSFAVPGNVAQVYVAAGDRVSKGQLLAELDSQTLQESYRTAVAMLRQAQDGYDRLAKLREKGSLPEIQWVEMETNYEKAKSAEKIAKKNLEDSKLYAPFSGIIGEQAVEVGMNVLPGVRAFTLLNINTINVKVAIPENLITSVQVGQAAEIVVPALNNAVYKGKVSKKGVVANPLSHSYEIFIPLNNSKLALIPGMVCKIQLLSHDVVEHLTLPTQVVKLSHEGEHFVWLAQGDSATRRTVEVDGFTADGIIIKSGLAVGEKVIVKGYQKVSEGTKIVVHE